ncbi:hypothetical protein HDA40_000900 [Hamadaea flava]|uniref:FtsX-like permease family protein n=1 Tax=Hamadaea flava TaxID=1742688 RepID=A0ABV8LRB2_9ACTN|nr:hypothetical protein [Hamadaea flava]MCP2322393.1 hypothetical protein [Hamadaea flava]
MIPLLALLIRARWAGLLTVGVLTGVLGALAAVGADFPGRTGDRLAADTIAEAPLAEREFRIAADSKDSSNFETTLNRVRDTPGLTVRYGQQFDVLGFVPNDASTLMFREDFCVHLKMTAGRCPVAPGEIVVPADQAKALQVSVGSVLDVAQGLFDDKYNMWYPSPDGSHPFDVVGVYTPLDQNEDYWGWPSPFTTRLDGSVEGPLLTRADAMQAVPHDSHLLTADVLVEPSLLSSMTWQQFLEGILQPKLIEPPSDGLPTLLDRVQDQRRYVGVATPAVVLPVLTLGCLVLFLLVSRQVQRERGELGVQAVRGLPVPLRWALGGGAPLFVALAGLVVGASITGSPFTLSVGLTAFAVAFAITVAVLPVVIARPVDALRQVGPAWAARLRQLPAGEVALVALAVTSLAFVRTTEGLGNFAPALLAAAMVLVVARVLPAVVRAATPRLLRAGRLVLGLAAAQLGRRPAARQLIALSGLAVALLALVASSLATSQVVREKQIALSVGADRVLSVRAADPGQVIAAVRAVDPEGAFAMPVGRISSETRHPEILALDLSRAAQLDWDRAPAVAAQIGPKLTERGLLSKTVSVTVTATPLDGVVNPRALLLAQVTTSDGRRQTVTLGSPNAGRSTLTITLPAACDAGCRLDAINGVAASGAGWRLSLEELSPYADISDWRVVGSLEKAGNWKLTGSGLLLPPEVPEALPAIATPGLDVDARRMDLPLSGGSLKLTQVGEAPVLPRIGDTGLLVDLDTLIAATGGAHTLDSMEVWLTASAPASLTAALQAKGVLVVGSVSRAEARTVAARSPAALVLRLFVGATVVAWLLLGAVLLAVARVDRGSPDLSALRLAGLRERTLRGSSRLAYAIAVLFGVLLGLLGAGLAWALARSVLPITSGETWLGVPVVPPALPVLVPVGGGALALLAVTWLAFARRSR